MDRILKDYKVMDRFAFLLSFLLGALMTITLQAQKIIPLWQNNMPNSKGITLKDSVARERVVQVGTPTIHVYEPSKAERTGTAVLIIPGGGYVKLAHEISGIALAKWYNTLGVTAFVLMHRFPQSPDVIESYKAPLQDGQRALRYIRAHAEEYGIDIHKVGVMGCSAGGHLAASLCAIDEDWSKVGDTLDAYSCKPSFAVLISPVISMDDAIVHEGSRTNLLGKREQDITLRNLFSLEKQVNGNTAPAILFYASNDKAVSPLNSIAYYTALYKAGIEKSSLHLFPTGGHAISLRAQRGSTVMWPELAEAWLIENGFLSPL